MEINFPFGKTLRKLRYVLPLVTQVERVVKEHLD